MGTHQLQNVIDFVFDGGQVTNGTEHDTGAIERLFALLGAVAKNLGKHSNVRFGLQAVCSLKELAVSGDNLTVSWRSHDFMVSYMSIVRDAVANADAVLLPVQTSALDVLGQEAAFDIVRSEGKWDRTILLWNRFDSRASEFNPRIEKVLNEIGLPIVKIAQRVAYAKAGAEARTGAEIDPKALIEIADVWNAIQGVLKR